jgi:hypothetical protein
MKKKAAPEVGNGSFKVWCEQCSIRIAPSEMRVASDGKMYHDRCYEKLSAGSKTIAASQSSNTRGHKSE